MERDNSRLGRDAETSSAWQKFRDIVLIVRYWNEFSMTEETSSVWQREMNSTWQRKWFSIAWQKR